MRPLCLVVLAVLALAAVPTRSLEYGYDYGYDGLYGDDQMFDYLDESGYYEDDADQYYDEYDFYADDDAFGYDDYYDEYYDYYEESDAVQDCTVDKGKVKLANGTASCDIRIEGVDKVADLLKGGLDGVYKLDSCHGGRPAYTRQNSPKGEERVLWYSRTFGDWDISKGPKPNEDDILVYGGDIERHAVPLFVTGWHLGGDLKSSTANKSDEYFPVSATVKCADGKVFQPPKVNPAVQKQGPLLTAQEIEDKYKLIFEKYGRRPEPNPTVNFSFVIMLVMIGLTIVLAIPYLLIRKRNSTKGYQPVATSFAQVIQQSKKKQSGHIH